MITTLDNVKIKRGQKAWEIGMTPKGIYKPTLGVYLGSINSSQRLCNEQRCWADYENALAECKKLNAWKRKQAANEIKKKGTKNAR